MLSSEQCRSLFRFDREDIARLLQALRIPDKVICSNRTTAKGTDALHCYYDDWHIRAALKT